METTKGRRNNDGGISPEMFLVERLIVRTWVLLGVQEMPFQVHIDLEWPQLESERVGSFTEALKDKRWSISLALDSSNVIEIKKIKNLVICDDFVILFWTFWSEEMRDLRSEKTEEGDLAEWSDYWLVWSSFICLGSDQKHIKLNISHKVLSWNMHTKVKG